MMLVLIYFFTGMAVFAWAPASCFEIGGAKKMTDEEKVADLITPWIDARVRRYLRDTHLAITEENVRKVKAALAKRLSDT